jgi:hypothetical protein
MPNFSGNSVLMWAIGLISIYIRLIALKFRDSNVFLQKFS